MRRAAVLILILPLAACAALAPNAASSYWVPAMSILADQDRNEPDGDVRFDADPRTGSGFAARVAHEDDELGVGILYLTTRHALRGEDGHVRTHSAYIEFLLSLGLDEETPSFYGSASAGAGAAIFDFDRGYHDTGSAAGMVRAELGLRITPFWRIHAGGGGYLWGYPGETIGTGGFVLLGTTLHF